MKRRLMVVLALILAFALVLGACGSGDNAGTKDEKKSENEKQETDKENAKDEKQDDNNSNGEEDVFRIGLEAMYPPFNWTQLDDSNGGVPIDESNEFAGGYDVEMAKKVAEKLGKRLVVVKIEWDGLVPALQSGVIDAIMAGMSPTEERKKAVDFSENYYQSTYVLVVKKGSKYENATSIQDFSGAKVTGQLNTTHYTVIDQIKGVDKQPAGVDFPSMRTALQSGAIDAYVTEVPEATSSTAAIKDFVMVNPKEGFEAKLEDTAVAVALRKNDPNLAAINEALAEVSEEERAQIMNDAIFNQPANGDN